MKTLKIVGSIASLLLVSNMALASIHEAYAIGNKNGIVYSYEGDKDTLDECKKDVDKAAGEYLEYGLKVYAFHGMCFDTKTGNNLYTATLQKG